MNPEVNAHGISVARRVRQAQRRRTSPTHEPRSRLCRLRCVGAALDAPYSHPTKRAASSTPERNTPMEFQVQTRADLAAAAQLVGCVKRSADAPVPRTNHVPVSAAFGASALRLTHPTLFRRSGQLRLRLKGTRPWNFSS